MSLEVVPHVSGTFAVMSAEPDAIDRINALLDSDDTTTVNTSMRLPTTLRDAAAIAVNELGVSASSTTMTAEALRAFLESTVRTIVVEEHYERFPHLRPTLADLAVASAELDGLPIAADPDALHRAAGEVVTLYPDATPDDVVLWARARSFPA